MSNYMREPINAITHLIGAILSFIALIFFCDQIVRLHHPLLLIRIILRNQTAISPLLHLFVCNPVVALIVSSCDTIPDILLHISIHNLQSLISCEIRKEPPRPGKFRTILFRKELIIHRFDKSLCRLIAPPSFAAIGAKTLPFA